MQRKINCKYNDGQAWCKCSKIKRKLWGIGARMCVEFEGTVLHCEFKEEFPKPKAPPSPPRPRPTAPQRIRDILPIPVMFPSIKSTDEIVADYEERIQVLEEALEFYGNIHNYTRSYTHMVGEQPSIIEDDCGETARLILQETTNED